MFKHFKSEKEVSGKDIVVIEGFSHDLVFILSSAIAIQQYFITDGSRFLIEISKSGDRWEDYFDILS